MKTILTNYLFLEKLYIVLEEFVKSEFDGNLPEPSLAKSIFYKGKEKQLSEKIFGSTTPSINYLSQRLSESKGAIGTKFNIVWMIGILKFINCSLPNSSATGFEPNRLVVLLANDFIKKYLPDCGSLSNNSNSIIVKSEKSLHSFLGTVNQLQFSDRLYLSYTIVKDSNILGDMKVSYTADGIENLYTVDIHVSGKIIDDRFLLLTYYNKLTPKDQCGVLFLEFSDQHSRLSGEFMGYFHTRPSFRGECKGNVDLKRI